MGKDGFLFLLKVKLLFRINLLVQSSSWEKCKGERAPTLWDLVSLPPALPPNSTFHPILLLLSSSARKQECGRGGAGRETDLEEEKKSNKKGSHVHDKEKRKKKLFWERKKYKLFNAPSLKLKTGNGKLYTIHSRNIYNSVIGTNNIRIWMGYVLHVQ